MASLQQKLNPILVNNVIGYHALDPPVRGPHELHQGGLVVPPLSLQAGVSGVRYLISEWIWY